MKIGIIGSGNVGANLAKFWAKNGHQIMLSYSRDDARLARAAAGVSKDTRTGAPREAVAFGDVVVLAVPWSSVSHALEAAGPLSGKVLHTTVNALSSDKRGLAV